MARKNIYVKEEHEWMFRYAEKLAGEVGLSQTIAQALQSFIERHPETETMVFRLQLIKVLDIPAISEAAEYRLRQFPDEMVSQANLAVLNAKMENPELFDVNSFISDWSEFSSEFMWSGLDAVLDYLSEWLADVISLIKN